MNVFKNQVEDGLCQAAKIKYSQGDQDLPAEEAILPFLGAVIRNLEGRKPRQPSQWR